MNSDNDLPTLVPHRPEVPALESPSHRVADHAFVTDKELRLVDLQLESVGQEILADLRRSSTEAYENRDWLRCLEHIRRVLQFSESEEAYSIGGEALLFLGDLEGAATYLQKAIAIRPSIASRYYFARVLHSKGAREHDSTQLETALERYSELLSAPGLDQNRGAVRLSQGVVLRDLERWDEAIASLKQVLLESSTRPGLHSACEAELATTFFLYGNGLLDDPAAPREDAVKAYEQSLKYAPDCSSTLVELALAIKKPVSRETEYGEGRDQRNEEAVLVLSRAIQSDPRNKVAYYNRGTVLLELDRANDAIPDLERAIGLDRKYHEAHLNLAVAHQRLGDLESATTSYARALELEPAADEIHWYRALMFQRVRRFTEAEAEYEQYFSAVGKNARRSARYTYAVLCYETQRFEEALSTLLALGRPLSVGSLLRDALMPIEVEKLGHEVFFRGTGLSRLLFDSQTLIHDRMNEAAAWRRTVVLGYLGDTQKSLREHETLRRRFGEQPKFTYTEALVLYWIEEREDEAISRFLDYSRQAGHLPHAIRSLMFWLRPSEMYGEVRSLTRALDSWETRGVHTPDDLACEGEMQIEKKEDASEEEGRNDCSAHAFSEAVRQLRAMSDEECAAVHAELASLSQNELEARGFPRLSAMRIRLESSIDEKLDCGEDLTPEEKEVFDRFYRSGPDSGLR